MSLQVSSSPHVRDNITTTRLMLDVIIALIPAFIASFFLFGIQAVIITLLAVGSAVFFEYLSRLVMKRQQTIGDLSAIVTGMLLAFNLPPTAPLWLPVIGSLVAIVVVKQMFGGIGQNFVNPALASRIILALSFPVAMTAFAVQSGNGNPLNVDLVASATPLHAIYTGAQFTHLELFLGLNKAGCLGEVSILALLLGAAYLVVRRVIALWIPLTYIGTVAIMITVAGQDPLFHVLSGGLVLGAFFMATDYVTSPLTVKGKIIFGICCGLLTGTIRLFGGMTEGVSYSIILMNIMVPHLERWTRPVQFGGGLKREKR